MAAPKNSIDQRLSDLTQYTAELQNMLDFAVQRIRQLEETIGRDSHRIERTTEWHVRLEQNFTAMLKEHNWHWPTHDDPAELRMGEVGYAQILRVAEMIPLDRCLLLWHEYVPKGVPLPGAWTDERPVPEKPEDPFKGRSTRALLQHVTRIEKGK